MEPNRVKKEGEALQLLGTEIDSLCYYIHIMSHNMLSQPLLFSGNQFFVQHSSHVVCIVSWQLLWWHVPPTAEIFLWSKICILVVFFLSLLSRRVKTHISLCLWPRLMQITPPSLPKVKYYCLRASYRCLSSHCQEPCGWRNLNGLPHLFLFSVWLIST